MFLVFVHFLFYFFNFQVPSDVPTCRAPPGLGNRCLTDASNRRGSDDMYGKDDQAQGLRLLGPIVSPASHQTQGDLSGILGGTMATNSALGLPRYPQPVGSMSHQHIPNQSQDFNKLHELHNLIHMYKFQLGEQHPENYPRFMFSPNHLWPLPDQKLPFTQASSPYGGAFSTTASSPPAESVSPDPSHKSPIGKQKQTVTQTGTSPGGMSGKATQQYVSGVNNQQAGRADANKQDQTARRHPGAAVRTSLEGDSPLKADSNIKKVTLMLIIIS